MFGVKPTYTSIEEWRMPEEEKEKEGESNAMAIDESEEERIGRTTSDDDILSLSLKTRRGYRTSSNSYQTVLSREIFIVSPNRLCPFGEV